MIQDEILEIEDDEIKLEMVSSFFDKNFYYKIVEKTNNKRIGNCGIRLDDSVDNHYLGNIEYEIFEEYRGNNYAYKASKLLGRVALYFGITELKITARPDNIPSIKTIEKLGAKFLVVDSVPKNMRLYQSSKQVVVYNWKIERENVK